MIQMSTSLAALRALLRRGWSREELRAFQETRLRQLVAHAARSVPFYRDRFERHGVAAQDVRRLADLHRIPVLSRAELQAAEPRDLVRRGLRPDQLITRRTSGSTGRPVTLRRSWFEQNRLHLFRLRARREQGIGPRDRIVALMREPVLDPRDSKRIGRTLERLGLLRRFAVNMHLEPAQVLARLRELDPDALGGFPSSLVRVAQAMDAGDRAAIRPRVLLCGGEVLPGATRAAISHAFGAPVYETYNSHEFNLIAWQCRESGLFHVCDDAVLVEVLDASGRPVGPEETGTLVGTALHSFAMPLIRYQVGDLVTRGPERCPCGAPFSTLRQIHGRTLDLIELPDGRAVHPFQVSRKLLDEPHAWIGQFQVVQASRERIELLVVPAEEPSAGAQAQLERELGALLGGLRVEIRLVPEIPLDASGKFRVCRSLVTAAERA
jgi:phenylacetate-CoA ligase